MPRRQLEAAVLQGGGVDAHERGEEKGGVDRPARLLVLMRLEAVAARHLEVDLVLEERDRPAEQRGRHFGERAPVEHARGSRRGTGRGSRCGSHPAPRLVAVGLPVDHVPVAHLRPGADLVGPLGEPRGLRGGEEPGSTRKPSRARTRAARGSSARPRSQYKPGHGAMPDGGLDSRSRLIHHATTDAIPKHQHGGRQNEVDYPREGARGPDRLSLAHQPLRRQGADVPLRSAGGGHGGGEARGRHPV